MNESAQSPAKVPVPPVRRRRWRWQWFAMFAALCVIGAGWNRDFLLRSWGEFLDVGRPLTEPVDVVFVLGGGFETRPFVAAEVYRGGYTRKILISQPARHSMDFLGGRSEADVTRQILERQGVPPEAIESLPLEVDSTVSEVAALRKYLEESRPARVAVVTSNYHTRRTRILLKRVLGSSANEIRIISAPVDGFAPHDWWQSQRGMSTYFLETLKLMTVLLNLG